jgi:hypothetical protein
MFQQTIQDLLRVAEAFPHREALLERLRSVLLEIEPFECGEILAETERGFLHFVVAEGLGGAGPKVLAALGEEVTLRLDTAEGLQERGLVPSARVSSLLVLRLEAPGAGRAAIALGHSRNWSFAAAPLSRLRAISGLALRLLLPGLLAARTPEETHLAAEVTRLKALVSTLDDELVVLRAEKVVRQRSDKPQ